MPLLELGTAAKPLFTRSDDKVVNWLMASAEKLVICTKCRSSLCSSAFYASHLRKRTYRCKKCVLAALASRRRQQPRHMARLALQAARHGGRLSTDTLTKLVLRVFAGRSALTGIGCLAHLALVPLDPTKPLGTDNAVLLTRKEARSHLRVGLAGYPPPWVAAVRSALAEGSPVGLPPGPCTSVSGTLLRYISCYGELPMAWINCLNTVLDPT